MAATRTQAAGKHTDISDVAVIILSRYLWAIFYNEFFHVYVQTRIERLHVRVCVFVYFNEQLYPLLLRRQLSVARYFADIIVRI